jgi:hypothetical protein
MALMILFLDTEFTDLSPEMELLSLALVSVDGDYEFYGERNDVPAAQCSHFVRSAVLPQLTAPPPISGDRAHLQARLRAFVESLREVARLACDSNFDMELFVDLIGLPWPEQLNPMRLQMERTRWFYDQDFVLARSRYHTAGHPCHHALHDAHGLRAGYLGVMWGQS